MKEEGQEASVNNAQNQPINSEHPEIYSEEQLVSLKRYFLEIKSLEDIQIRAKQIMKKNCAMSQLRASASQLDDYCELTFMRVIFSYHPTRDLPLGEAYPILAGICLGHQTFFIQ